MGNTARAPNHATQTTPKDLLLAKLYTDIAVPLHSTSLHQPISLALLAQRLGAKAATTSWRSLLVPWQVPGKSVSAQKRDAPQLDTQTVEASPQGPTADAALSVEMMEYFIELRPSMTELPQAESAQPPLGTLGRCQPQSRHAPPLTWAKRAAAKGVARQDSLRECVIRGDAL